MRHPEMLAENWGRCWIALRVADNLPRNLVCAWQNRKLDKTQHTLRFWN